MTVKGIRVRCAEILTLLSMFKGTAYMNLKKFREMRNASLAFGFLTRV